MDTPNLEAILSTRPYAAIGQAQPLYVSGIDRVNTQQEKAAILAHLTLQLAALDDERPAHGNA